MSSVATIPSANRLRPCRRDAPTPPTPATSILHIGGQENAIQRPQPCLPGPARPLRHCLALAFLAVGPIARAETIALAGAGGQPAITYQAAASPFKPYVAQLYTPARVALLRDAPADHLHHHALMFALSVEGVTFWEERAAGGRQVPRDTKAEPGRLSQTLDWTTPQGKIVLHEERLVRSHPDTGRAATLLTWRSRLHAPKELGRVTLSGSHYYGLGARFVVAMDQGGAFFNSAQAAGESVRGTERLATAAWGAYTAAVEGRPVTFAIFSHPANLRHPPRIFTMTAPFAYLASTLNLWKEPYVLESAHPLELRYGVAAWDGKQEPAAIEALYQSWLKLAE